MVQVVINGFQNIRNQFFSQKFPLLIDIYIAATGEVDTFERAGVPLAGLVDCEVRSLPSLLISNACPGCSSLIFSTGTFKAV